MIGAAYLAVEGLDTVLGEELALRGVSVQAWHGRLALSPEAPIEAAWAQDIWREPVFHDIASIGEAVATLRGIQRNWGLYAAGHHRRCALIAARLPRVAARPLQFPQSLPDAHLGAWTLLGPDRLLCSARTASPFVRGEVRFVEDHIGPPSRAYLKLWEALTLFGEWPQPGETCLDLGAAPGGWTWALAGLGATVTAVDKAPLDARVAAMPNVRWSCESAFARPPHPVDWLCSDVIAYPSRLFALVQRWIQAGAAKRIVCTVKFQGATDHAAAAAFAAIPGGRLRHLFHNKHELTFTWRSPGPPLPSPHPAGSGNSP